MRTNARDGAEKKTKAAPRHTTAEHAAKAPMEHVAVRLSAAHLARVDALRPRYSRPWRTATRSDVMRALILHSLDVIEAQQAPPKSTRRPQTTR